MAVKFVLPMRVLVHILYQKFNKNFNLVYFTKDKIGPLDRLFSFEKANFENFTVDDLEFLYQTGTCVNMHKMPCFTRKNFTDCSEAFNTS